MRIEFKTEGGFAFFPGLSKPVTIDSDEFSDDEVNELQRLLQTTRFFDLPTQMSKAAPQAADMQKYKITIKDKKISHTVQLHDTLDDPDLQKLLTFIKAKASQKRTTGKK
ncbi:MAG: hypothetical protein ONB44_18580 [candidate division KSB1 bacterium]|nr:hypothetical protein [candidate division KSB1 bacterium]MDZ7304137.1 hypothetical protein [candidate division KSB1 bacterium]MDZ7314093.1 hypothetical protein [candidate division KSB1 bacterium]